MLFPVVVLDAVSAEEAVLPLNLFEFLFSVWSVDHLLVRKGNHQSQFTKSPEKHALCETQAAPLILDDGMAFILCNGIPRFLRQKLYEPFLMFRDSIGAKGVRMSVSKHDRDEYEQGREERGRSTFDTFITDITGQHPDSDAYYKGRDGEQLDEDKKDK